MATTIEEFVRWFENAYYAENFDLFSHINVKGARCPDRIKKRLCAMCNTVALPTGLPLPAKNSYSPTSMRTLPHKFFLTPWEELQVQTEGSYSPPEPSITGDNCDSINTEYVSNHKDFSLRSCIWHLGHPKDDVSPQGWKREGKDLALAIPRHTCYADTIKDADMVKCYFKKITKQDYIIATAGSGGNTRQGFWLIKEGTSKTCLCHFPVFHV